MTNDLMEPSCAHCFIVKIGSISDTKAKPVTSTKYYQVASYNFTFVNK